MEHESSAPADEPAPAKKDDKNPTVSSNVGKNIDIFSLLMDPGGSWFEIGKSSFISFFAEFGQEKKAVISFTNSFGSQMSMTFVPWSKVAILGMVIPPLIGILIIGI